MDSEINMIPMIDLMMVTIAFLLITAVWSTMARIDASANVPGRHDDNPCDGLCEKPAELHVDMHAVDKFVLTWRKDGVVLRSTDVPRRATEEGGALRYADLAAAIAREHAASGTPRTPRDLGADRAVLHTANDARYEELIAAMDAIYAVRRPAPGGTTPAFAVTFSTN